MSDYGDYHSYLLRIWSTIEQGELCWRAMLEDAETSHRIRFNSLERLFAFLEDQTEAKGSEPGVEGGYERKLGKNNQGDDGE